MCETANLISMARASRRCLARAGEAGQRQLNTGSGACATASRAAETDASAAVWSAGHRRLAQQCTRCSHTRVQRHAPDHVR